MSTKKYLAVLFSLFIINSASASSIWLTSDSNEVPEPNQEVTVWVHTDTPLLCMQTAIQVSGDANITSAMRDNQVTQYGWDNGWHCNPLIKNVLGWASIYGVRWAGDANGVVGYFKFRYYSGQVLVFVDQDSSVAFGWDEETSECPEVPYSTDVLVFGTESQSQVMAQPMRSGLRLSSSLVTAENETQQTSGRRKVKVLCPAGVEPSTSSIS